MLSRPATSRRRKCVNAHASAGTREQRADTHAARTTGAQSIGSRSRPCQALNCVGSRYGRRKSSAETIPSSCMISDSIRVATTAAARVARDRREQDRQRGDGHRRQEVGERGRRRSAAASGSTEIWLPDSEISGSKPQIRPPSTSPTPTYSTSAANAYVNAASTLADEDLPAVDRAGEDRLQRPVAVLGGHDVARDQRGDQREEPERAEEQPDERDRQPGLAHVVAERDALRTAVVGQQRR